MGENFFTNRKCDKSMKKWIYIMIASLFLVACSKTDNGYDALERGLIGILEKRIMNIL